MYLVRYTWYLVVECLVDTWSPGIKAPWDNWTKAVDPSAPPFVQLATLGSGLLVSLEWWQGMIAMVAGIGFLQPGYDTQMLYDGILVLYGRE